MSGGQDVEQYKDRVVEGMEMLYGKSFLSPGGAPEVAIMLEGVDLSGLPVLDRGCGLGGATLMLARDHNAGHVTGIDVETDSLERARVAVEAAVGQGWERYLGAQGAFVGMTGFGASAPAGALHEHFGITAEAVAAAAKEQTRS